MRGARKQPLLRKGQELQPVNLLDIQRLNQLYYQILEVDSIDCKALRY